MMNKLDKQLMPSAVLLFLAAVIFAGALLWHDTVGVKYSQMSQQVGAPQSLTHKGWQDFMPAPASL
jgi:hypothetical protein